MNVAHFVFESRNQIMGFRRGKSILNSCCAKSAAVKIRCFMNLTLNVIMDEMGIGNESLVLVCIIAYASLHEYVYGQFDF